MAVLIRAGKLNKRVTLQRSEIIKSAMGQDEKVWANIGTVWAGINTVSGREFFQSGAQQSTAVAKITIRYCQGIDTDCRVLFKDEIYNIIHVDNMQLRNRRLVLVCENGTNES